MFGRSGRQKAASDVLPGLHLYLHEMDSELEAEEDGAAVEVIDLRPHFDAECRKQLWIDDPELVAQGLFYTRLAGGTHYRENLQRPEFALGSSVYIMPESPWPADPPGPLKVCAFIGDPVFCTVGHVPRELNEVLRPQIPDGGWAVGAIVGSVTKNGTRTGLRIVGALTRKVHIWEPLREREPRQERLFADGRSQ